MKVSMLVLAGAALVAAGAAQADDDAKALLQKSGCTACHAIDKKLVGPAYNDVSTKYKGDAGAAAKLAEKVKKGGSGVWGPVPMSPNPVSKISDADLKVAVEYILSLAK